VDTQKERGASEILGAIERMRCWVESWEGASSEGLLGLRLEVLVIKIHNSTIKAIL
jgi:hypothetical protein